MIVGLGHEMPRMILEHLVEFKNKEILKHTQVHKCVHTHKERKGNQAIEGISSCGLYRAGFLNLGTVDI